MKKTLIALLALTLACLLALGGCAAHGKTLIKAGGEEISVNIFQLYLSRQKGELKQLGEDVNSDKYWSTILGYPDQTTVAQHYTARALEALKHMAAALILYEEEGLKLDKSVEKEIDAWLELLVETLADGSKTQMNSILSAYGANLTVLRDDAVLDAKIRQLKTHLFGENASKVDASFKERFYLDNYYRGKQMLISNYYYDHEKDADKRTVYYLVDDKGNLKQAIAYDTVNGTLTEEQDKFGNPIYRKLGSYAYDTKNGTPSEELTRDKYGNLIYYRQDDSIAYDTEKGKPYTEEDGSITYRNWVIAYDEVNGGVNYYYEEENGETVHKIAYYTTEEMQKRYIVANDIANACLDNEALFDEYAKEYSATLGFDEKFSPNGMYFASGTTTSDPLFSQFATELDKLEDGELTIQNSTNGYYILMRCELDEGAWAKEENGTWFESFTAILLNAMLQQRTAERLDELKIDEKLLASVDITMVDANTIY